MPTEVTLDVPLLSTQYPQAYSAPLLSLRDGQRTASARFEPYRAPASDDLTSIDNTIGTIREHRDQ